MMDTITSDKLKEFVDKTLRGVEIKDKDLEKSTSRSESVAHRKIIDALCTEWSRQFRVYPQSDFEGFKIDFIGRQKELGKILLAVEIDTGVNEKNWVKLADVNAICKVWILLDKEWQAQFTSEEERKQAWEDWLNGQHPRYTPDEFNRVNRFWYSYGPDAGELVVFIKSPDFVGSRSISSGHEIEVTSREIFKPVNTNRAKVPIRADFLLKLKDEIDRDYATMRAEEPTDHYLRLRSDLYGVHFEFWYWGKDRLSIDLHFERGNFSDNNRLSNEVLKHKSDIEKKLGQQLNLKSPWLKKWARIYVLPDINSSEQAIQEMEKFRKVLLPILYTII